MRIAEIISEVENRKEHQAKLRQAINQHARANYGIEDFFSLAGKYLPSGERTGICLARQLTNANVEQLGLESLADWLERSGLKAAATPLSFTADAYRGENRLKKSYCRVPFLRKSAKGRFVQYRSVVEKWIRCGLEGMTLRSIPTYLGKNLPQYHADLRETILPLSDGSADLSDLFLACLKEAVAKGRLPEALYVENGNKEKLIRAVQLNGHKLLRPTADWYYELYLLLFVDGSRILLSTVDDCPRVCAWFSRAKARISEACGYPPLIIDTPCSATKEGYASALLEIPEWIMEDPGWRDKIDLPPSDLSVYDALLAIYGSLLG